MAVPCEGPYLVMKLIEGRSLGERLHDAPPNTTVALHILRQVAAGLAHAHQRGILHRDIKPSNILEDHDGRVVVVDFAPGKPTGGWRSISSSPPTSGASWPTNGRPSTGSSSSGDTSAPRSRTTT